MITIQEVLNKSESFFLEKGIDNSRRQAEEVIADSMKLTRTELYMQFDRPMQENELVICREALARRAKGEPCQYILGFVEFHDCIFNVDSRALIPRQETEILVDLIMKELDGMDLSGKVLWDVCTGTGCIGITLKKKFPALKVILSDISEDALALATENAGKNGVEVSCLQGDLLHPFIGTKADFVVCNPPYISLKDFENLEQEVKGFEPKLALVSGNTGLEFYQQLAEGLPLHLNSGGKAWFEIGEKQGKGVKAVFSAQEWTKVEYQNDWSGHDRFFFLEIE